jgi:hypothetical protein
VAPGGETTYASVNGVPYYYEFHFDYIADEEQRKRMQAEIDAAASLILNQATPEMTEYDKVKMVYDYIITNTEYDESLESDQSLYNVLVNGKGVCSGYAKATQYLLNKLGVFCLYIPGEIRGGLGHAWNLVRIDGEYYFLDATWGDPVFTDGESNSLDLVYYDYFCVTADDLLKTHVIDSAWMDPIRVFPKCTATAQNYYVKNDLYFEDYDYSEILSLFKRAALEETNIVEFRFSNENAYSDAVDSLFQNDDLSSLIEESNIIPNDNDGMVHISYFTNDDLLIIKIILKNDDAAF